MVIYLQADIGRINALFRKAHRWQLTDRSIQELEAEAYIKLGTLLTFYTNYYLHTDQFDIHFENEVIRSSYRPALSTKHFRSTFINQLLFQSV